MIISMAQETDERAPRADAQRNRAAIIDAAVSALTVDPRASMADIAKSAGIGRVTLYGHFSSRRELIDAIVEETMQGAEEQLGSLALDGDPQEALEALVTSSWRILVRSHGILAAAEQEVGPDRIRDHHDETLLRVRRLIERGQAEGSFRTDQSAQWLTACFFSLLHGAAAEIRGGRISEVEAVGAIPATILALVGAPVAAR